MKYLILLCAYLSLIIITNGQNYDPRAFAMFANCIVSYEPEQHGLVVIRPHHQGFIASSSADKMSLNNLTLFIDQPNRLECIDTGDNIEVVMYENFHMEYNFFSTEQKQTGVSKKTSFDLGPQNIVVVNGIPQSAREFARCRIREVPRGQLKNEEKNREGSVLKKGKPGEG